jgi:hypothetical protein
VTGDKPVCCRTLELWPLFGHRESLFPYSPKMGLEGGLAGSGQRRRGWESSPGDTLNLQGQLPIGQLRLTCNSPLSCQGQRPQFAGLEGCSATLPRELGAGWVP